MKKNLNFYIALLVIFCLTSCQKGKIMKAPGTVDQETFTATFPFKLIQGVIVMEVNLKGQPYEFVLDTGGFNLIDKKIAEELGIKGKSSIKIPDSQGNKRKVPILKLDEMEIAGVNFLETGTGIVEFDELNAIGCLELKGMIGSNLMQNAVWEIDYQQQLITISHSMANFDIPSDSYRIPFNADNTFKSPNVEVTVNGQLEQKVEIDLGSNDGFNLSKTTFEKIKVTNSISGNGLLFAGLYGYGEPEAFDFATIDNLSFGDLDLTNQVVAFKPNGTSTIGNEFLKNYRVIFNWFENELTLIPVTTPQNSSLETFGIQPIFKDQKPLVGFIYENSNAQKEGLKATDELIEINGQNLQNISLSEWCEVKAQFNQSTEQNLSITIQRNGQILGFELEKSKLL